jgi:Zn-dependent M28 family amino/carboxypeptidase
MTAQSVATALLAAEPLLSRVRFGRGALAAARAVCAVGLGLLAERELRGVDVPGANDNASGAAVATRLGMEYAAAPPESTRVVVLVCGCEESGLLGARAFLDAHDTSGWLFVNFDGVAAPATLRYLPREGIGRTWPADERLQAVAEDVRSQRPELGLEPADAPIGLTYDATAVLARGGRALTLVAGDGGRIPNYHQPSDTVENLDPAALERALEVGRELVARIDRGAADPD